MYCGWVEGHVKWCIVGGWEGYRKWSIVGECEGMSSSDSWASYAFYTVKFLSSFSLRWVQAGWCWTGWVGSADSVGSAQSLFLQLHTQLVPTQPPHDSVGVIPHNLCNMDVVSPCALLQFVSQHFQQLVWGSSSVIATANKQYCGTEGLLFWDFLNNFLIKDKVSISSTIFVTSLHSNYRYQKSSS